MIFVSKVMNQFNLDFRNFLRPAKNENGKNPVCLSRE